MLAGGLSAVLPRHHSVHWACSFCAQAACSSHPYHIVALMHFPSHACLQVCSSWSNTAEQNLVKAGNCHYSCLLGPFRGATDGRKRLWGTCKRKEWQPKAPCKCREEEWEAPALWWGAPVPCGEGCQSPLCGCQQSAVGKEGKASPLEKGIIRNSVFNLFFFAVKMFHWRASVFCGVIKDDKWDVSQDHQAFKEEVRAVFRSVSC